MYRETNYLGPLKVSFVDIIGVSMSETLSSELHLSVCLLVCLFVGLSVCLSVCLSWIDRQLTVNHFRLLFCTFCVVR